MKTLDMDILPLHGLTLESLQDTSKEESGWCPSVLSIMPDPSLSFRFCLPIRPYVQQAGAVHNVKISVG